MAVGFFFLTVYIISIQRVLLGHYVEKQKTDEDQRVREKQVLSQTLEGLVCLVTIVTQRYKQDLVKFLTSLGMNTHFSLHVQKYIKLLHFLWHGCSCWLGFHKINGEWFHFVHFLPLFERKTIYFSGHQASSERVYSKKEEFASTD